MSSERQAFMEAILRDPEDDTVRLVFADWLEEHGGEPERAEFIRVQINLAKTPKCWSLDPLRSAHQCPYCNLVKREYELLTSGPFTNITHNNAERWAGKPMNCDWAVKFGWQPPKEEGQRNGGYVGYRIQGANIVTSTARGLYSHTLTRGFVSDVTCTAECWLAAGSTMHWHPNQTVDCLKCEGHSWYHREGEENDFQDIGGPMDCEMCNWSGRIPRPIPPTAQPIREVTLTTPPEYGLLLGGRLLIQKNGGVNDWECETWPGITFHLPPA